MIDFDWLRPEYALLLGLAIVPLVAGALALRSRLRLIRRVAEPRHLARLFPGLARRAGERGGEDLTKWLRRRAWLRATLSALCLALVVVGLLGPVRGYALVPVATRQIDVVVALDTSRSMLVEDVTPNRLERAKAEIGALFDTMQGERVALIAFAGLARNVTPLTRDVSTAQYFLEDLDPSDNRKGGTDIGAALTLALERFDTGAGANQAIVLVTDGEDLTGEGLAAAEEAAKRDIRVHVLGMGTSSGGKVPDGDGGFVVDPAAEGGPADVVSKLESTTLRALAEATGGIYLEAKGRVLPLEELYERAIAGMEGRDIVDGKERVPRDRYQWVLALALLVLVFEGSMRETNG